ncbi:cAMP-regulated phosphoprotein/endosulfine conserved region, partial [Musa troglodytarum]
MAGCNEGNVASQGEEVRHPNQIMTNYWGERNLWTTKIFYLYHMETMKEPTLILLTGSLAWSKFKGKTATESLKPKLK